MMEQSYGKFAEIYDKLMFDVPYDEYADFIEKIFTKHNLHPELILDLACGTGSLALLLSERGYDVIGADASLEMLSVARRKNGAESILFLNQSMQQFELYGTVDVIICALDSLNYVTNIDELYEVLRLCANYLNDGGLLIFDVNSEYKFRNIFAKNTYSYETDDVIYIWENCFDEPKMTCDFFLTFFIRERSGLYERFDEQHVQRCYTDDEICSALLKNGFSLIKKYDGYTENNAKITSERILYEAVKVQKRR